ncbi:MAG: WD40 repeat domain-containing protein [bacterium]
MKQDRLKIFDTTRITLTIVLVPIFTLTGITEEMPLVSIVGSDDARFLSVDISSDGQRIVTGSTERSEIWDAVSGQKILEYNGISTVSTIAFSPDGKYVLSGGIPYLAKLWDATTGETLREFRSPTPVTKPFGLGDMTQVAFTMDGKKVITEDLYGQFQVWEVDSGKEYRNLFHTIQPRDRGFMPMKNSNEILVHYNEVLQIWDFEENKKIYELDNGYIPLPKYSNYSRDMILYTTITEHILFDISLGKVVFEMPFSQVSYPETSAVSSDGRIIIFGGRLVPNGDRKIFVSDSKTPARVLPLKTDSENSPHQVDRVVKIFPDGKKYLTLNGNAVHIWDISDLASRVKESENLQP